ncbi:hypothetical protein VXE65_32955 [Mycolicibacterium conceptionense]|uniref:hypothetical protein n=1 Tax=Mycolicibacterium conceptionense TaxID=451644 RepID=UPI0032049017
MSVSTAVSRRRTGRPHLGPRNVVPAAMWPGLLAGVDHARGSLDRSAFLADLLSRRVGRPDLARHNQLPLDIPLALNPQEADEPPHIVTIRVHPDVTAELDRGSTEAGLPRRVYLAKVIADELGYTRPATAASEPEVLPMAM